MMVAFFQGVSVITTALVGAVLAAATIQPLTTSEKHRLAAYISYLVAVDVDGGGGETVYRAGDYCPSCNPGGKPLYPQKGPGWVGDGTVFEKCAFETDDGKLACMGTGTLKQVGDVSQYEEEEIVNYGIGDDPIPEVEEVTIYKMPGSTWNWEGRSNVSEAFMRAHLIEDHGIDATGMSVKQMRIVHDNAHNYGDDKAFGSPNVSSGSRSSCPSGNCPTSSGPAYSRRRGLFRR